MNSLQNKYIFVIFISGKWIFFINYIYICNIYTDCLEPSDDDNFEPSEDRDIVCNVEFIMNLADCEIMLVVLRNKDPMCNVDLMVERPIIAETPSLKNLCLL